SRLIDTNGPSVSISISNMVRFSEELDNLTSEFGQMLTTNRVELRKAVSSLNVTAEALQGLVNDVEAGKGVLGGLVKDEQLKTHIAHVAINLDLLSSNLNRYGLLYKPKQPKGRGSESPIYPGKSPFER